MRERIVAFMYEFHAREGVWPTIREIGRAVGLSSTFTVHWHLQYLVRGGRAIKPRGRSQSYALTPPVGICPTCGRCAPLPEPLVL